MNAILSVVEREAPQFPHELDASIVVLDVDEFETAGRVLDSYLDTEARTREEADAASEFLDQYLKSRTSTPEHE